VPYLGRPGISPALALLIAEGRLRPKDRILDVGCGTGTDALLLARWGFRHVVGIDPDRRAIATARQRAARLGLADRVRFEALGAEGLPEAFRPRSFDVILHTLVANNLEEGHEVHFEAVAGVLRRGGTLLLHERLNPADRRAAPGEVPALEAVKRWFRVSPGVTTHLAEGSGRSRGHALVAVWVGTRR
jgi:SAM-dependent methyltransferase